MSNNDNDDQNYTPTRTNDPLPTLASNVMMARVSAIRLQRKTEKTILPVDYEPSKCSIICGRGKGSYQSDGNVNFRALVKSNLERYKEAPGRLEKSFIVSEVLNMIRESYPLGAFVKHEKGRWYALDVTACREKVGSLFRDFLHTEYRSSSKAKHAKKVADNKRSSSASPEKAAGEVCDIKEPSDSGVKKEAASPKKKDDTTISSLAADGQDDPLAASSAFTFYDIDDLSIAKM